MYLVYAQQHNNVATKHLVFTFLSLSASIINTLNYITDYTVVAVVGHTICNRNSLIRFGIMPFFVVVSSKVHTICKIKSRYILENQMYTTVVAQLYIYVLIYT